MTIEQIIELLYPAEIKTLLSDSIKTKDNFYLLESFEINLSIDLKNESYTGNSGCNSFFGKVEMVGQDKLLFRVGGITEMMCEQSVMEWESRFLNALMESEFTLLIFND